MFEKFSTLASITMASRALSRGGYPSSSHGHRLSSSLSCNRCRKHLSTTVFVCACDCVFCEECTYQHFQAHSNCPNCGQELKTDDFLELCIADPSPATQDTLKNTFQHMLTKFKSDNNGLTHQEVCSRLLKVLDNDKRAVRFLMKQFVFETGNQGQVSGNMGRAYEQMKQELTTLKKASSSQRIEYDQKLADLQNHLQVAQQKIAEKDQQIAKFRHMFAGSGDGTYRVPSSSHSLGSTSSGGKRGRGHHMQAPNHPPLQVYTMNKENHLHSARPFNTPIQLPAKAQGSLGLSVPPGTPRTREFSTSSSYGYSGRGMPSSAQPISSSYSFHQQTNGGFSRFGSR